ncbi:MAG: hypothetical protein HYZ48_05015, partial [Chlamydiales bacterium]|nr:hypothetical protein [Chlamydiales bacterium]
YLIPMAEMAATHIRFIPEILYVFNCSSDAFAEKAPSDLETAIDKLIRSKTPYAPLETLPLTPSCVPPESIYQQLEDLFHPTWNDYRFVQNYLRYGKRENLSFLGNMAAGLRQINLIGHSADEIPLSGRICVNCTEEEKKNCVLIYATFNRNYPKGAERLIRHIVESDYKGHILYRIGGFPDEEGGSLRLSHVPYAFKAAFFQEAKRLGYQNILWLDTAVIPLVSLNELFSQIEEKGYFIMGNSHPIGPYMNPQAAVYFGLTLEQTHQIPSCSAGLFGIDLSQKKPSSLLEDWYLAAHDPNAFFSLRSDQNALSMLLYQYGMTNLTPIEKMPHAETADPIKPGDLFYLDRLFVN